MRNWLAVFVSLLFLIPTWTFAEQTVVVVRDRSGRVIEKHYITQTKNGRRTVVRNPTGKRIRVEILRGKKKEIRDPMGRLLRTETVK